MGEKCTGEDRESNQDGERAKEYVLAWNPRAICDGFCAEDRVWWSVENLGIHVDVAMKQVMNEFLDQFRVWVDPSLTWDTEALCAGRSAEELARWYILEKELTPDAARQRIMNEFPDQFRGVPIGSDYVLVWKPDTICKGASAASRAKWCMESLLLSKYAARNKVMYEFLELFRVWVDPTLTWDADAVCGGETAKNRVLWCIDNLGISENMARRQVMHEFSHLFVPVGESNLQNSACDCGDKTSELDDASRSCFNVHPTSSGMSGSNDAVKSCFDVLPGSSKTLTCWNCIWQYLMIFELSEPLDERSVLAHYAMFLEGNRYVSPYPVLPDALSDAVDYMLFAQLSQASKAVHRSFKSNKGWMAIVEWDYPRGLNLTLLHMAMVLCWFDRFGFRYAYPCFREYLVLQNLCLSMSNFLRDSRRLMLQHQEHGSTMLMPDVWYLRIPEKWWKPALSICLGLFENLRDYMHVNSVQRFQEFVVMFFPEHGLVPDKELSVLNFLPSSRPEDEGRGRGADLGDMLAFGTVSQQEDSLASLPGRIPYFHLRRRAGESEIAIRRMNVPGHHAAKI